MLYRNTLVNVLVGAVLAPLGWGMVELGGGQRQAFAQEKDKKEKNPLEGKKGKTIGNLVSKGEAFIEVKADGEEKARRYVPRWVGGAPAQGGGPEKSMLKTFQELKLGSRVEVDWLFEERFRAVNVKLLAAPKDKES